MRLYNIATDAMVPPLAGEEEDYLDLVSNYRCSGVSRSPIQ